MSLTQSNADEVPGSDPHAGTKPSVLTHKEILRSVSLYYLTKTFVSGVYIYAQNPNGFKSTYTKAQTDAPMLFSAFKYNPGFWVKDVVATVGNLVLYRSEFCSARLVAETFILTQDRP